MKLWNVKLVNSSTDREYGPFILYTNQEGEDYAYDTDQISTDRLFLLLSLSYNEPWKTLSP